MVLVFFRGYLDMGCLFCKIAFGIGSGASWHIVCCDFCCERTDRDPFCAKNVFFVCRNHDSAKLTILHRQHDPLPPTWSFPTNMIFSHQHDPFPPAWSFPTSMILSYLGVSSCFPSTVLTRHLEGFWYILWVILLKDKNEGHPSKNCLLEGKDHAGGKRSWWWERIMLVGKDHAGGGRLLILQKYDFCMKKYCFLHRTDAFLTVCIKNHS